MADVTRGGCPDLESFETGRTPHDLRYNAATIFSIQLG